MTQRRDPPFTQAAVTRAVRGCEKAGCAIERVEVRADGTIVVIARRSGEHSGPQPSDRDREMARDAVHRWGIDASERIWYAEPGISFERALTTLLAAARAEGRRKAIEECARIADKTATFRDGGPYHSGHFQACRDIAIAIRALAGGKGG